MLNFIFQSFNFGNGLDARDTGRLIGWEGHQGHLPQVDGFQGVDAGHAVPLRLGDVGVELGETADIDLVDQIAARETRGMRTGMRSNCVETMTVGTRTCSFGVEIEKSKSRTGSCTHSSQATGFK